MRNGSTSEHLVQERGLWCTELTFGAKNSLLVYATRFQRHSVQKNRLLLYGGDILYRKPPSPVQKEYSVRRTASWCTE